MCQHLPHQMINLGFCNMAVPPGTHICQIFSSDDERDDSLDRFLVSGLKNHEAAACFSNELDRTRFGALLSSSGLNLADSEKAGALTLRRADDIYFSNNIFDPDLLIDIVTRYYRTSMEAGFGAARVIGEMLPAISHIAGGERLLEYESRITLTLRDYPVTAVCQYDARLFDGATIMKVLKVHPMMIVRGHVVHNPFHISPEDFLGL